MAHARFNGRAADQPQAFRPVNITLTLETNDELKAVFALANWSPTAQLFGATGAAEIRQACRDAGFVPVLRKTETAWLRQKIRERLHADGEYLDDNRPQR